MKDAAPVMGNSDDAVQNAKCRGGNGEEIHCSDGPAVVAQERPQRFADSEFRSAFCIQRRTVRSQTSNPSILSLP